MNNEGIGWLIYLSVPVVCFIVGSYQAGREGTSIFKTMDADDSTVIAILVWPLMLGFAAVVGACWAIGRIFSSEWFVLIMPWRWPHWLGKRHREKADDNQ